MKENTKIEGINEKILYALTVAEDSKIPVLLMANPGAGKTTTVKLFAEKRGYHYLALCGSQTTADEVAGFMTAPVVDKEEDEKEKKGKGSKKSKVSLSALHIRPDWFEEILEVKKEGGKTLLFLDELTTANEMVQGALLSIIFEKKCKTESLPEDTLIVAAGNYSQNLSASMSLIAPMMNRFAIFNVSPNVKDVCCFLSRYKPEGMSNNPTVSDVFSKYFATVDSNKKRIAGDKKGLTAAKLLIEESVRAQTISLMGLNSNDFDSYGNPTSKAKKSTNVQSQTKIDFSIKDLGSVYSTEIENQVDSELYGFTSLRTLGYLVDWAISTYKCFGTAGLRSDSFLNSIKGLCGIGTTRNKNKSVELNTVYTDYFTRIGVASNSIDSIVNPTAQKYVDYFENNFSDDKKLEEPDLINAKQLLDDMIGDSAVNKLKTPLMPSYLMHSVECIKITNNEIQKNVSSMSQAKTLSPESLSSSISYWNRILGLTDSICQFVVKFDYTQSGMKEILSRLLNNDLYDTEVALKSYRKAISNDNPGSIIPQINTIAPSVDKINCED